ncbi:MAG: hypothetical protein GW839_07530 [Flavobacteriales bacterium]|nr:hypothetical protein [Flavobacteriales bacterium]NCP52971.1 hypothetical protein [Flavobacteriales bacterium]NCP60135.1 hypothetical protein [Flavobacteriales bacterium]NCQ12272.1 hypothetical protein [Bacteroidota bacterium]
MIRFDGYYLYKPVLYQERKEHKPSYLNMAYLFKDDGTVIYTNKWSTKKDELLFTQEEFDRSSNKNCYEINGNKINIIDKCEKGGYEFHHDVISEMEIKDIDSGNIMRFVPWKKQK